MPPEFGPVIAEIFGADRMAYPDYAGLIDKLGAVYSGLPRQ